jgi:hypothetical protein
MMFTRSLQYVHAVNDFLPPYDTLICVFVAFIFSYFEYISPFSTLFSFHSLTLSK